jgi:putative peptide zinc metalloprotease protein
MPATPVVDPPRLASNVELAAELEDTAFAETQWLIRRGSRFVQVSELLYRVAEQVDGRRDLVEIAAAVTDRVPWLVTAEHVERLVETKLIPLGLVESADGGATPVSQGPSPLQLMGKVRLLRPQAIDPVTRVLQTLFRPPVAILAIFAIAGAHAWLYWSHGLTAAIIELIMQPALIVPLFAVIVVAGIFHEFGHASALRYGGGRARAMGFGFYLVYPALYTDTSEAYRLGRWAKVRVDLGGFYFHLLFALGLMAVALVSSQEFLLVAVFAINLEIIRQLIFPFVRFDGYWLLADLTGVPDLFAHAGPVLRSVLPGGGVPASAGPRMKPWARRVFFGYLLFAVVALTGLVYVFATRAPRFVTTNWESLQAQAQAASEAFGDGVDPLAFMTAAVQIVLLALPLLAAGFLLYTVTRLVLRIIGWARHRRGAPASTPAATAAPTADVAQTLAALPADLRGARPAVAAADTSDPLRATAAPAGATTNREPRGAAPGQG